MYLLEKHTETLHDDLYKIEVCKNFVLDEKYPLRVSYGPEKNRSTDLISSIDNDVYLYWNPYPRRIPLPPTPALARYARSGSENHIIETILLYPLFGDPGCCYPTRVISRQSLRKNINIRLRAFDSHENEYGRFTAQKRVYDAAVTSQCHDDMSYRSSAISPRTMFALAEINSPAPFIETIFEEYEAFLSDKSRTLLEKEISNSDTYQRLSIAYRVLIDGLIARGELCGQNSQDGINRINDVVPVVGDVSGGNSSRLAHGLCNIRKISPVTTINDEEFDSMLEILSRYRLGEIGKVDAVSGVSSKFSRTFGLNGYNNAGGVHTPLSCLNGLRFENRTLLFVFSQASQTVGTGFTINGIGAGWKSMEGRVVCPMISELDHEGYFNPEIYKGYGIAIVGGMET